MHGFCIVSAPLVNAEGDSMGGVVDGGVGIGIKTSPRQAAIERAQAELRQEYDVRAERRRELEFLEIGGNPLDFKFGHSTSLSVLSTSLTDQQAEHFVTSEAKGSFALTASPHGDSVESSGRPGAPIICEPNSADNLLLLGENELLEGEKNTLHPRGNVAPSEQSSQLDGSQNAKESEDSNIMRFPKSQSYTRRNRSRTNRDGARSSSTDIIPTRVGHGSSLPARHGLRDAKGLISEVNNQKDLKVSSICNSKSTNPEADIVKTQNSENQLDSELNGVAVAEKTYSSANDDQPEGVLDVKGPIKLQDDQDNQHAQVGILETPTGMASDGLDFDKDKNLVEANASECPPSATIEKPENQAAVGRSNGFGNFKGDRKIVSEGQNNSATLSTKGLDSESSCTQTSISIEGINDSDQCNKLSNVCSNGNLKEQTMASVGTPKREGGDSPKEKNDTKDGGSSLIANHDNIAHEIHRSNGAMVKTEEVIERSKAGLENEVIVPAEVDGLEMNNHTVSKSETKSNNAVSDDSNSRKGNICNTVPQSCIDSSICRHPEATLSGRDSAAAQDLHTDQASQKVANTAHEDSVLEEARIIEAKRKRIAQLSASIVPLDTHRKSHWDFVLEEMAWLANDFAQERIWKITTAAQLSCRVALASQIKSGKQSLCSKQKQVAHTLAKAVLQFWHSVEEDLSSQNSTRGMKDAKLGSVRAYAMRFLEHTRSIVPVVNAEAPMTPDRVSDSGILEVSWEDQLTEESLFYAVPSGAMGAYRKSIENCLIQFEKTGSSIQEEVETSTYDGAAEFVSQEIVFEEDEGETSTYYLPSKSSKFSQKKRKNLMNSHTARSYEVGVDLPYGNCMENKVGTQQSVLILGKRPATLNVGSFQTKRVRTASRQRVISPFNAGPIGGVQVPNRTDASSGETSSFQDDQSTLHGGSQVRKGMDESMGEFDDPYDCTEISTKPKKKKKAKHLGSAYEQRWPLDSTVQNEQRDYTKKRLESHQLESNGSSGLFGQHAAKKPKIIKQPPDNSFDNVTPITGSIPSPVASQMSNMSNPNKIMRIIGGRDRGRKPKVPKVPAGQSGSGSPWSLFEDQALVVLVHDMGPNWELVSDAINCTLQFKGSARQLFQRLQGPMEEDILKSHFEKIIMIGQQQHYRRNQSENQDMKQIAPVHNSHVVALSQVSPNLNGGPLTPLDLCDVGTSNPDVLSLAYQGSHTAGLPISNHGTMSSMLPISGANSPLQGSPGVVLGNNLSPSGALNASVRVGVPRTSSLPIDEQQRMQQFNQMHPGRNIQQPGLSSPGALSGPDRGVHVLSGANGMGMMCGINRSMPMPRSGLQAIASSSMLNSGSMLSSSMGGMPSPVNMHHGAGSGQGNSMLRNRETLHMMRPSQNPEHQRQMMMPELQLQVSQGNSQGVLPFNGLSSAFPNQTASPPIQSYPVHHQQQHQMPSQQPHVLSNPHHPHLQSPNHATSTQQAYAIRLAKERQRLMQQQQPQQQHFAQSNALMPHLQSPTQLPISSLQSSQMQPQSSSQPVSLPPQTPSSPMTPISSQHQQKHHLPLQGLNRNPQTGATGSTNQMGKQRQRQPQQQQFQQSGRQHPQQRQPTQSQQQAKMLKGLGRGNALAHQNLSIDSSHLNGLSTTPGGSVDKGEQVMHVMQGQGLYSGTHLNSVQPSKSLAPSQPSSQSQTPPKLYTGPAPASSKQLQQRPSQSDTSSQPQVLPVSSGHSLPTSYQAVSSTAAASLSHGQLQLHRQSHQKQANLPVGQRIVQQNCQIGSDLPDKALADQAQAVQLPGNSMVQMGTSVAMPQTCTESTNVVSAVSPVGVSSWKAAEPLYDSGLSNQAVQFGSVGSPPLTSSAGVEPKQSIIKSSGSLSPHGQKFGAQWQQQGQLQQPPSPSLPPPPRQQQDQQQQLPSLQQLPLQQQSQQHTHLQAGQSSLYIKPTNSRLE
ncbi:Helicase/SANT-associated domain [Dillenia turbinata]|uniref:Helicase/SANT-associated domain n=1 Tax=Dillenia turbinata TaxID=194707 RepID=A0AAN8ZK39_9MAGN